MILTVTPNPSLDRTVELSKSLKRGEVQRATRAGAQPGGKGINISRALASSGLPTLAVLPGAADDAVVIALAAQDIDFRTVPIAEPLRSNITLTEPDGTTTKVNEPGPLLTSAQQAELIELVLEAADGAAWLVLAGSLPPGMETNFYAQVIEAVRSAYGSGAPAIAVDSSGAPLRAALTSEPDLIKPNAEELAELLELDPEAQHTMEAQIGQNPELAEELLSGAFALGARSVLLTLGAHGAIAADGSQSYFARSPKISARSTVGAGDSALAGFLYAQTEGKNIAECLRQAVAHGAAAAALPGSTMPTLEQTHPDLIEPTQLSSDQLLETDLTLKKEKL